MNFEAITPRKKTNNSEMRLNDERERNEENNISVFHKATFINSIRMLVVVGYISLYYVNCFVKFNTRLPHTQSNA